LQHIVDINESAVTPSAIQMPTVPTIQLDHSPALVEQAIQETEEQANLDVLVFHHNVRNDLSQF